MILNTPISDVLLTWVPPQSSTESVPILITRTLSSYFSSKNANAPDSIALSNGNTLLWV